MILVDTSVWVDHLRKREAKLAELLENGRVVVHPFIVGELALGKLGNRQAILDALLSLPTIPKASDVEFQIFVAAKALDGTGIGFVDAHLLASLYLMPGALIWTRDKRLAAKAHDLKLHWALA